MNSSCEAFKYCWTVGLPLWTRSDKDKKISFVWYVCLFDSREWRASGKQRGWGWWPETQRFWWWSSHILGTVTNGQNNKNLDNLLKHRGRFKCSMVTTYTLCSYHTTIKCWSEDSISKLHGCLECTDWSVFYDACDDCNDLTEVVSSYISFCVDTNIPNIF